MVLTMCVCLLPSTAMPDAQMLACVFMFLPAGMLSLIGGCAAADKPEEAKEPQPAVASQVPPV